MRIHDRLSVNSILLAIALNGFASAQQSWQPPTATGAPRAVAPFQQVPVPYQPDKQYIISTVLAELSEAAFAALKQEMDFESQTQGAMATISEHDASEFPDFLERYRKNEGARVLSRPKLATIAGQPCEMTVGSQVAIGSSTEPADTAAEQKPVGIELKLNIREKEKGRHQFEWELTNSLAVSADADQIARSRHGFDGSAIVADGEAVLLACPTGDQSRPWLIAVLSPRLIVPRAAAAVQAPAPSGQTLPSPYLAHDVQYFPPGPEFQLQRQVDEVKSHRSQQQKKATAQVINPGRTLTINSRSRQLRGIVRDDWILRCPIRVSEVTSYDHNVLGVVPVDGKPDQLRVSMKRPGTTSLTLVLAGGDTLTVDTEVRASDAGLSAYLRRLFPAQNFEVHPVNGAVLLRGTVHDAEQRKQVRQIAETFFPKVLDQMAFRNDPHDTPQRVINDATTYSGRVTPPSLPPKLLPTESTISVSTAQLPLFLTKDRQYTLVFPARIICCDGVEERSVQLGIRPRKPNEIQMTARSGMCRLVVQTESGVHTVVVFVEDDVSVLSQLIGKLYPQANLSFVALKSAVLVRGNVATVRESEEIQDIASQYFPAVLNHLSVGNPEQPATLPAPPMASAVAASPAIVAPLAITPSTPMMETPQPATVKVPASARNDSEIDAIRAEVRALHADVRDLISILQQRNGAKENAPGPNTPQAKSDFANGRTLLYFHASYCAPCQAMDGIVASLDATLDGTRVQAVDITQRPDLTRRYKVDRIPTFILVLDGQTVDRRAGVQTEAELRALVRKAPEAAAEQLPESVQRGVWLVPFLDSARPETEYLNLVQRVAADHQDISLAPVVAKSSSFARRISVATFPTLLLMKDGEIVDHLVGPATQKQLTAFVDGRGSYLSRTEVPFSEDSVVAIRRIDANGVEIHPMTSDVGVVIASEPGRSVIAVPQSSLPQRRDEERMLVYLFPGTSREVRLAADIKLDLTTIFPEVPAGLSADAGAKTSDRIFALLEIQYAEVLPVCKLARTPAAWWKEDHGAKNGNPEPRWMLSDGDPFVIYRPRSLNNSGKSSDHVVSRDDSKWLSCVCRDSQENWNEAHTYYRFEAGFAGAVIAFNRHGQFLGFGSAIPQKSFIAVAGSSRGRSGIRLGNSLEFVLAFYFGTEDFADSFPELNDPLVLQAVDPEILQFFKDHARADGNVTEGNL